MSPPKKIILIKLILKGFACFNRNCMYHHLAPAFGVNFITLTRVPGVSFF